MAFNWQTFRTRTLTAAIFVAVMLAGLLWNQWSFLILFFVIHLGCWWEYLRLMEKIHQTIFHPYVKMGFMVIGLGLMLWFCGPAYQVNGYGLKENFSLPVSGSGFALLLIGIFQKTPVKLKSFGAAALGLIYISLCWGFMVDLRIYGSDFEGSKAGSDYGYTLPLFIVTSIWINDTMAYIAGSLIGRTPLSKISPKKTWEGTIGGILISTAVTGFLFLKLDQNNLVYLVLNENKFFILPLIISIFGTIGDLLESKLKRMADVKDSGSLMPGHGGFLDRFDSMLLATPFVWLYFHFLE